MGPNRRQGPRPDSRRSPHAAVFQEGVTCRACSTCLAPPLEETEAQRGLVSGQGCTASWRQSCGLNPGLLCLDSALFTTMPAPAHHHSLLSFPTPFASSLLPPSLSPHAAPPWPLRPRHARELLSSQLEARPVPSSPCLPSGSPAHRRPLSGLREKPRAIFLTADGHRYPRLINCTGATGGRRQRPAGMGRDGN